MASVEKVLVVGPSWVGDMMMAQAFLKAFKHSNPAAEIDLLAPKWSHALAERMPEVTNSIVMPVGHGELNLKSRYELAKSLRSKHYQQSFVLPNSFKSALIPFLAKIPHRTGWRGEYRYGLLNDWRVLDKQRYPKMVQRYIALALAKNFSGALPDFRPSLNIEASHVEQARQKYHLTLDKPVLVLCPGAEFGPSKRWPESHYAQVADHYYSLGWQVWVMGSAKDHIVAEQIQNMMKGQLIDLTGQTSLGEAIDLMSLATLVITNDSGLMHIAAALNRPLVAVYGSTDPGFTPPLTEHVKVVREPIPCSPCFKRVCPLQHHQCMTKLSVDKVIQASNELVGAP